MSTKELAKDMVNKFSIPKKYFSSGIFQNY